jgi:hypothetical protein
MAIEQLGADVLYLSWLYVVGSRIVHPKAPRWPDMEFILHGQGEKLFYGQIPQTIEEAYRKVTLGRGYSVANFASNRRNGRDTWDKKQLRRFENPSAIGALFIYRVAEEPKDYGRCSSVGK